MVSPKRLVVAWDGGEPSEAALAWAMHEASAADGLPVQIVRVVAAGIPVYDQESNRHELAQLLDRLRRTHRGTEIDCELAFGNPVDALRGYLNEDTLVVVGSKKISAIRNVWSIGARLAGEPGSAVAIIPINGNGARSGVVVGVDGSPASDAALRFAAAQARRSGEPLLAIHAWQEPPVWQDAVVPSEDYLRTLEEMHAQILGESLEQTISESPGLEIQRRLIRSRAARALVEAASTSRLLVVGNHGQSRVQRFVLGSVSQAVVLNISSPTIVVSADR